MTFDPEAIRNEFPLLALARPPMHYLDNAATSQIHRSAMKAMADHDMFARGNVMRGNHGLAEAATLAYEDARARAAQFLNAGTKDEIVFTSGTTAALNLVAASFGETLHAGDEIVISMAEHHSNWLPWQMLAQRKGLRLRFLPLTAEGHLDYGSLPFLVTDRCRMVALAHVSNVTGAVTDAATVVEAVRKVGASVLLDGAQQVQDGPVDVQALGIDFYTFSGHKCFGPTGIGVLWGRSEKLEQMPPSTFAGGMVTKVSRDGTAFAEPPRRFEAGTPPIAAAVALGATLGWLAGLPWEQIRTHEHALTRHLIDALAAVPGIRILGPADLHARAPVVSFDIPGLHPHDVCQVLDRHRVALRGGHHCAQPLMAHFGIDTASRASIALYNTAHDIDAMLTGLDDAIRVLS